MPKLSVWMVRASLLYMAAGFLFGSLLLHHKGVPIYDWTWKLRDPHIELMIFGWVMEFVMGIAYWILPRIPGEHRFGATRPAWYSFVLLNAGILLSAAAAWDEHSVGAFAGRTLTLAGLALFATVIYPRVKPLGSAALQTPESLSQSTGEHS
jgi:hypothetical protein